VSTDIFTKRGITPPWEGGEVARARGYAPYAAGDVDAVYEAMDSLCKPGHSLMIWTGHDAPRKPGTRRNPRWVKKFTRSEGWVIPKHRVFEHLPHIRPQLRPDEPVLEGTWRHNHLDNAVDAEGRRLSEAALAAHRTSKNRAKEHHYVGLRREHEHSEWAKYGIAPREDMVLPDGGRWLYDDSKRLDHNPISDFSLPGPVFFGIEGTPKNDAMVEWLREHGRPAKVVNVPGVSMWRAPELALFALRHMRGSPVVIVPDADWATNDEVIYHAECCAAYLHNVCGVDVIIAAPPVGFGRKPDDKGVDDWLGPNYGGSLDELHVIEREFDDAALDDFRHEYRRKARARGARGETVELDLEVARLMGRTVGNKGLTLRSTSALTSARFGRRITEEEALAISVPDHWPRWSNPVSVFYAHIRRENEDYTAAQEHATYRSLARLEEAGAYQTTGIIPDWVDAHWEVVGRRPDGSPRWARKKGGPGSRIEMVAMDERLRVHEREPVGLGEYLAARVA
jgi:hypothetical protein